MHSHTRLGQTRQPGSKPRRKTVGSSPEVLSAQTPRPARNVDCSCGGGCPTCQAKNLVIQPKLKLGQANDRYEQEADQVAERVMRMPEPEIQRQAEPEEEEEEAEPEKEEEELLQAKPVAGADTGLLQRQPEEEEEEELLQAKPVADADTGLLQRQPDPEEEEEEDEELVQAKPIADADASLLQRQPEEEEEEELLQPKTGNGKNPPLRADTANAIHSLRGGGQALDSATRSFMEPRFGRDFSQVRVHTGNRAAELAQSINARAFTIGRDVVMGAEGYSSASGRKLLAHELTHVVQQSPENLVRRKRRFGSKSPLSISRVSRRRLQRSEAVFVSTHGRRNYMRLGIRFHQQQGFPAAQRVSSVEEMLEHMATMRRPINRIRLLTHAIPEGIFLPLLRGGGSTLFQQDMSLSRRFELQQELGTSHPTVRRGPRGRRRYVVVNTNHHLMPRNWVGYTWQYLYNNSTPVHHNLISSIRLTRRPNPMTEMHNFFWWVIDRTMLQMRARRGRRRRMAYIFPMSRRRRREMQASLDTNVSLFRNRVIAGPYSTGIPLDVARRAPPVTRAAIPAATVQQLETAIADGARAVFAQRRQVAGVRYSFPNRRYRSIQGALRRGTYARNLLRVKYLIANGGAIEIRGCRIGQNRPWLETFRDFLGHGQGANRSRPHVSAPKLRHVYRQRGRVVRRRGRRGRRTVWGPVTEHMELVVRRGRRRRTILIGPNDPRFAANIEHAR